MTVSSVYSLVYSSSATVPFSDDDLGSLLEQSRRDNERASITGMLLYRSGQFIQFLEGPKRAVRDLLDRIIADTRHADVRVLVDGTARSRQFTDWTMGYEPLIDPTEPLPPGFRSTFDDLESSDDPDVVLRVTRELSLWFRVRATRDHDTRATG